MADAVLYIKGTEDQRGQVICSQSHSWQMEELSLKSCAFQDSTLPPLAWDGVKSNNCSELEFFTYITI